MRKYSHVHKNNCRREMRLVTLLYFWDTIHGPTELLLWSAAISASCEPIKRQDKRTRGDRRN